MKVSIFGIAFTRCYTLIACYRLVLPNCYNITKKAYYKLIRLLPPFLIPLVFQMVLVVVMVIKGKLPYRFVAVNAFSNIIKEKSDSNGGKRWLFKKINLTDEEKILSKVFIGLFSLFTGLLTNVFSIFWSLLLIDISYSCDEDDAKDCFEYEEFKLVGGTAFAEDPVDCTNPAITNGTMDVVCYKLVFNAGVAYGTFKMSMALINAAAAGMLMVKQTKTIKRIKIGVIVISLAVFVTLVAIQSTSLHVRLVSDTLIYVIQTLLLLGIAIMFVCVIPWIDLLVIRQRQNNPDATSDAAALDHDNTRIPLLGINR